MVIDKDCYTLVAAVTIGVILLIAAVWRWVKNRPLAGTLTVVLVLFNAFVIGFHRVPEREAVGSGTVVSAVADGKVVAVEKAYEAEYLKRDCMKVSIYMNFFDVHANFWPVTGEVSYYKYHPGKYLLAFLPKSSDLNEHASTAIRNDHGELLFKQIAGTFARRLVCYSKPGLQVEAGRQCGIIKFGSRIDMYLPLEAEIRVKVGDRTRAAETVVAVLQ